MRRRPQGVRGHGRLIELGEEAVILADHPAVRRTPELLLLSQAAGRQNRPALHQPDPDPRREHFQIPC